MITETLLSFATIAVTQLLKQFPFLGKSTYRKALTAFIVSVALVVWNFGGVIWSADWLEILSSVGRVFGLTFALYEGIVKKLKNGIVEAIGK